MSVRARPVGPSAVLVDVAGPGEALALAAWVRDRSLPVVEVVPAAATVLLDGVDPAAVLPALAAWEPTAEAPTGGLVEVSVTYDGEDLDAVADAWGTTVAEVVERHAALTFVSAFCGFAPGFAYLAGLPDELSVPRLDSPRPRVPAGSVALAGTWCGVYPTASPGGWRIIGRTDVGLWDTRREPPALLPPGTRVRFVPA
ncbi:5-oxoprolinase subunit B family protein [Nocardioides abyssi]|uniref:Allophanate hydrolase subunit 1 n=1 Tax=Nocardioides abyssi TaxID=3058370 RepID=A0ABT8EYR6_9ACTN|nr:allophanate hydrolase subunit 1 [Nocardioides abyssi]MDN4163106.1 allophanate hydrolase subunit 1 [Nocardioides abyssi]